VKWILPSTTVPGGIEDQSCPYPHLKTSIGNNAHRLRFVPAPSVNMKHSGNAIGHCGCCGSGAAPRTDCHECWAEGFDGYHRDRFRMGRHGYASKNHCDDYWSRRNVYIRWPQDRRQSCGRTVRCLGCPSDQPAFDERECGADEAWLSANYAKALEEYTHRKLNRLSSKQIDLFKSRLVDLRGSQTDFEELFKHWHTDDSPKVSVNVKADNREFGVQSDSQFPFMLPWQGTDSARGGYTCRISRAVAGVVGRGFPNRDRLLLGDELRRDLMQQTMNSIKHDWDLLDTQNRVGTEVAPVFAQFTVLKSEISNLSSYRPGRRPKLECRVTFTGPAVEFRYRREPQLSR
jgi:hypothetical protein